MTAPKPITIVGGGLAGLTLGIGLRQRGVPVTIWEAGRYPRHRVCGEFICGRGQEVLARLGLLEAFLEAGAITARTAVFFLSGASSPVRPLPMPALCLPRFALDALLAKQFRQLGGDLREQARWQGSDFGEGIVRASGRRLRPQENGWRWFALKTHARNVSLAADLEVHGLPDGYVGLCRLKDDAVNVCGLFRRRTEGHAASRPWQERLRGARGTPLHARLATAVFDEGSFCSVAGLALRPRRAAELAECCLGDALTMIPPVTGNGMSMAFESAELAAGPLAAYSRGELAWTEARQRIARACDRAFARRLAWADWLQRLMFAPSLRGRLASLGLRSAWLWQTMFARTR